MPRYAMTIDLSRCMGCRACMIACKVENDTGRGAFWNYVFRLEEGEYPNVRMSFLPRPCMHCENAACVKVCPVGARFTRQDGIVLTDYDRCIGCRYCMVSCPYGVNTFAWKKPADSHYYEWNGKEGESVSKKVDGSTPPYHNADHDKQYGGRTVAGYPRTKGVMSKCTFCVHRVEKGLQPACVANCPVGVYKFGDLDDPHSEVSVALRESRAGRLLEELGTNPKVIYLEAPLPRQDARQVDAIPAEVR